MRLLTLLLACSLALLAGCAAYDGRAAMASTSPSSRSPQPEIVAQAGSPQPSSPAAEPALAKDGSPAENKKSSDLPGTGAPAALARRASGSTELATGAAELSANAVVQKRDLVIYTARITMSVYQVEQGLAEVERIARESGGYLGQRKDREITVRVPRARFETMLASIDRVGDVLHREISADDVTDEHVDTEIRIRNARAMQHRLTELLAKASVKDALEIEKELHRVTEELERLEGRLKVLKDRIAFSTITVAFEPRGATLPSARVRLPFAWLPTMNLPSLLQLSEDK